MVSKRKKHQEVGAVIKNWNRFNKNRFGEIKVKGGIKIAEQFWSKQP